jgi:hypothetical protein
VTVITLIIRLDVKATDIKRNRMISEGLMKGSVTSATKTLIKALTKNTKKHNDMVKRRTWYQFRKIGLLWWVNRILHMFGWAIVFQYDNKNKGALVDVYPARVKYRGFTEKLETKGFKNVSRYLKKNIVKLTQEAMS